MIVFISKFPSLMNQKDGFTQRIAWIDELVCDLPRIYLDISLTKNIRKKRIEIGVVTIFQLNFFLHFFFLMGIFKKSSIVYIHSVYNALKAIPAYWFATTITDMHGIVPEEMRLAKKPWRARLFGYVECIALAKSSVAIFVTKAMKEHFFIKYKRNNIEDKIIPILPKIDDERGLLENFLSSEKISGTVIYAGGIQSWQNIPLMLNAASSVSEFKFIFLSSEYEKISKLAIEKKIKNFSGFSVAPNEVATYYLESDLGFILRDPIAVNQVACPTKLVEYFHWGVIPIVLTPEIGDFNEMGFEYILIDDFISGNIPNSEGLKRMRLKNRKIIDDLNIYCNQELLNLKAKLRNIQERGDSCAH